MTLFRLPWHRRSSPDIQSSALHGEVVAPPGPSFLRQPLAGSLARTFSSLAIPQYRMLWFGLLFSMAATQMDIVSRSWLAYHISGSGFALGLVALARGMPMLAFSLVGGVAADRWDKRKVLVFTQTGMGVLAVINAVLVHRDVVQVWHLVVLGLFQGIIFAFNMPARQAYVPELVGQRQLANAMAMNATGMNINRVLAPVLAGFLLAWEPTIGFYAISVLYLGAVLTLFQLPPGRTASTKSKGTLSEILVGFRYIKGSPALLALLGMAFLVVLLGMPYQSLLPVFQKDVLHVGESELGIMYSAVGVGSFTSSMVVAYLSGYQRKGLLQLGAGLLFGVSLIVFAISTIYELSVVVLFAVGLASQGYMTLNSVLLMLSTNKELYGRVMSIYMMTWSLMPVALLPMGALVDAVGAPITVAGAGILLLVAMAGVAVARPELWRKDKPVETPVSSGPQLGEKKP